MQDKSLKITLKSCNIANVTMGLFSDSLDAEQYLRYVLLQKNFANDNSFLRDISNDKDIISFKYNRTASRK